MVCVCMRERERERLCRAEAPLGSQSRVCLLFSLFSLSPSLLTPHPPLLPVLTTTPHPRAQCPPPTHTVGAERRTHPKKVGESGTGQGSKIQEASLLWDLFTPFPSQLL